MQTNIIYLTPRESDEYTFSVDQASTLSETDQNVHQLILSEIGNFSFFQGKFMSLEHPLIIPYSTFHLNFSAKFEVLHDTLVISQRDMVETIKNNIFVFSIDNESKQENHANSDFFSNLKVSVKLHTNAVDVFVEAIVNEKIASYKKRSQKGNILERFYHISLGKKPLLANIVVLSRAIHKKLVLAQPISFENFDFTSYKNNFFSFEKK